MGPLIAAQLSHQIARAGEDGFYIIEKVNEWFAVLARNGAGVPLPTTFDDELAAETQKQ